MGFAGAWSSPVIEDVVAGGPADKAGLKKGDVIISINDQPALDGAQVRAAIRASGAGHVDAQDWVIERAGRRSTLRFSPDATCKVTCSARVNAFISQPEMVQVRRGFWDGLGAGVQDLGAVFHDAAHDGAHGDWPSLAQEYQRPFDDCRLCWQVCQHGSGSVLVVSRAHQHQFGRSQPATITRSSTVGT